MNYSMNMKGWKTMDNNTKTYGRKVIRSKQSQRIVKNRFLIFTAVVLLIGALLGALIAGIAHKDTKEIETGTTSEKNEYIMQHVNHYGAYDGRIFTSEISMDWSGDEFDFTPLDCKLDEATQQFTFYLCKGYDIDWTLVMALMQKESSFRSDVISATDDYGLMQINKCNHKWLTDTIGVTDFLDKEQNIRAGVFVLRKLFEEYTDPNLVLMAYNMGADGAETLWNKGIYTTPYVDDILTYQAEFNKQIEERNGDQ
jgi:hypothetical protein|nr:MAG TPA: hypothetical protein [Bacteriophage sp.]